MGLFIDGDGIPLAFNITSGNTNEQITLKPLEKQILSDFELSKFIVCTDAGLSSTANKRFNSQGDRAFITTQSLKKLKVYLKEWALNPNGWCLDGDPSTIIDEVGDRIKKTYDISSFTMEEKEKYKDRIFYKQRWVNEDKFEQNLIVTYSLKYKCYKEKIRNEQIKRAENILLKNPDKYSKKTPNDCRRFIKQINCTVDGEIADKKVLAIDYDVIAEENKYDGFYGVYTNLEADVNEIIKVNKNRWQIEECFRIMKSEFEARPVYVKRDRRIEAHFMTCFVALLIYRLFEKQINEKYTCSEILSTLKSMEFYEVKGEGYIPTYKRTDITDKFHEKFGFRTDYEIVTNKQMKKIFKRSK